MSIMLIMSCYTGFFNVRRGWQSLNTGPRFYLRLIRRTGWLWINTSRTTDGRPFKPKKLSVPFLYPGVPAGLTPFRGLVPSRAEKPGAYSTPGTPKTLDTRLHSSYNCLICFFLALLYSFSCGWICYFALFSLSYRVNKTKYHLKQTDKSLNISLSLTRR